MEKIGLIMFTIAVITALIGFGYIAVLSVKDYLEEKKH